MRCALLTVAIVALVTPACGGGGSKPKKSTESIATAGGGPGKGARGAGAANGKKRRWALSESERERADVAAICKAHHMPPTQFEWTSYQSSRMRTLALAAEPMAYARPQAVAARCRIGKLIASRSAGIDCRRSLVSGMLAYCNSR